MLLLRPSITSIDRSNTFHSRSGSICSGIFIGALTFTGSIIAWGKLDEKIMSKALIYPGRHTINVILLLVTIVLGVLFAQSWN
ncbi:MAG: NAD(P)(+) transhydrogenase (Re/Si-specific) subunit beta [Crocinitomicaceae bacterium]